jgi:hypothetical protein
VVIAAIVSIALVFEAVLGETARAIDPVFIFTPPATRLVANRGIERVRSFAGRAVAKGLDVILLIEEVELFIESLVCLYTLLF